MAAVVANDGDEPVRVGWGTARERAGGKSERVPGGGMALRETSRGRRRQPGREEVAGVWPRAPGTRPSLLARGGRRQGARRWWAGPEQELGRCGCR